MTKRRRRLPDVVARGEPVRQPRASQISQHDPHIAFADVQFDRETPASRRPTRSRRSIDAAEAARAIRVRGRARRSADQQGGASPRSGRARSSASSPPSSSCSSPSARSSPWACRSSPRSFGIGVGARRSSACCATCSTMPDVRAAARGDDRPRRRHRLRAVHRHPLPRGPAPRAATREAAVDRAARHRRAGPCCSPASTVVISLLGMLAARPRRSCTASRSARSPPCVARHGRVAHAAAGAARLRRAPSIDRLQHPRPAPHADPAHDRRPFWYRWSRVGAAPPVARSPSAASPSCSCWRCRCCRCGSASPTPATTRPTHTTRQAYDLLAEGFGAGFNGPLVVAVELPTGRRQPTGRGGTLGRRARRPTRARVPASPSSHRRRSTPAGQAAVIRSSRRRRRRTSTTEALVHHLRDDGAPGASPAPAGRGPRRRRHRRRHRRRRQLLRTACRLFIGAVRAVLVPAADGGVPLDRSCRSRPPS